MAEVGDVVRITEDHWHMEEGQEFTVILVERGRIFGTANQAMPADLNRWNIDPRKCRVVRHAGEVQEEVHVEHPQRSHTFWVVLYKSAGSERISQSAYLARETAEQFAGMIMENPDTTLLAKKKITVRY